MKAVFFDRDGVLNEVLWVDGKPTAPRTFEEFKFVDGVQEINKLRDFGYKLFVVTNQPDISKGFIDLRTITKINNLIYKNLDIQEISICPHTDEHNCYCRKPKPGMIINLAQRWGISLRDSFLVGDMWRDIDAGRNANCKTILVDKPYNQEVVPDYRIKGLGEIFDIIRS